MVDKTLKNAVKTYRDHILENHNRAQIRSKNRVFAYTQFSPPLQFSPLPIDILEYL
jgi:hypothetical protein